jgi:membrane protease YdiL (CAAX protease family)
MSRIGLVTYYAVAGLIALAIVYVNRNAEPFKHNARVLSSLLYVLGAWLLGVLVIGVVSQVLLKVDPIKYADGPKSIGNVNASDPLSLLVILRSVVVAPVLEEIVNRLGLLGSLRNMTRKPWLALVVSSLVFSALHIQVMASPLALIPTFFMGLFLGLTYLTLGLPWAILLHALSNLMPRLENAGVLENHGALWVALVVVAAIGVWVFTKRSFQFFARRAPATH